MSDSAIQTVVAAAPAPLPRFQGALRFQAALDQDKTYRVLVLVALSIAGVAGAGFGTLPSRAGEPVVLAWSLMASGLIVRCIGRRSSPGLGLDWRDILLLGVLSLVLVAAASFTQPTVLLRLAIGVVIAVAPLVLLERLGAVAAQAQIWLGPPVAAVLAAAFGYWVSSGSVGVSAVAAAVAVVAVLTTWRPGRGVGATIGLTRAAGIGWALLAWGGESGPEPYRALSIIALVIFLALDLWSEQRRSFAAVATVAVFLQLATLPPFEQLLFGSLLLQPLCSVAVFVALAFAGWRFMAAARLLQPTATYRIAPLCVVPRLDRGLDHPVKISVA